MNKRKHHITKAMLKNGYDRGIVRLAMDDIFGTDIVCWIGAHYFYFDPVPSYYDFIKKNYSKRQILRSIYETLNIGDNGIERNEYEYYYYILMENGCNGNSSAL